MAGPTMAKYVAASLVLLVTIGTINIVVSNFVEGTELSEAKSTVKDLSNTINQTCRNTFDPDEEYPRVQISLEENERIELKDRDITLFREGEEPIDGKTECQIESETTLGEGNTIDRGSRRNLFVTVEKSNANYKIR